MKTLYDPSGAGEIKTRIAHLTPQSNRLWGKMTPAQALAHCSRALEVPLGDKSPPRLMIGRLIGWMFKPVFSNEKALQKNSPTDPSFVIGHDCDLPAEQARLSALIDRFSTGGPEACTKHPHSFFGKLTPAEWGTGMYKHIDHHLRQFGV